ncbi:D-inositol-3-phosphate glycosyltransferase [Candidatus Gugararchaeum adminiculabundum]|nr:D-inositol-3-phosphate glycosyltransferase [Candidatus Gugararchaeum adminiculabundum]
MKIAILLNYPLQEQIDVGHLDVLIVMYENLLKMFDEVHVVSLDDDRKYDLGNPRIIVHSLPGNKRITDIPKQILAFRKLVKQNKIDVVRVLAPVRSGFLAASALARTGVPFVLSVHGNRHLVNKAEGTGHGPVLDTALNLSEKYTFKKAALVAVISHYIWDYVKGLGCNEKKLFLHRNFVDTKLFKRANVPPHSTIRMVFISRLVKVKGVDILLKAMKIAKAKSKSPLELWIVGDGPEKPELEKLALELGLGSSVKFLGAVKHEKLPEILSSCDFFAAPALAGFVLNESLACGVPVLAADIEWSKEVIGDDVGMLIPYGDENSFSQGILKMIEKKGEWKRLGENARRLAEKELSKEAYEKRELGIYKKVLKLKIESKDNIGVN